MARLIERKFEPARPAVARKHFIANGRKFSPGMDLDWRKMGIAQRRVMQMFDAGKLAHTVEDKIEVKSEPKPVEITVEDNPLESLDYYDATDDLDAIDDMKELRRIADEIGAPYKVSKADQRQAIRDHRGEA